MIRTDVNKFQFEESDLEEILCGDDLEEILSQVECFARGLLDIPGDGYVSHKDLAMAIEDVIMKARYRMMNEYGEESA